MTSAFYSGAVQDSVTRASSARRQPGRQRTPAGADAPDPQRDRVWTIPNALSVLRLVGIGAFLWLALGPHWDLAAFAVLVAAGVTDYLDGYLARRLGQYSRLGALLDPIADRLYILAVIVGLALRHVIPWWLVAVLALRDLMLWALVPLLRTRGYHSLPVHFLGKAATFNLLYAFPLLLLADGGDSALAMLCRVLGWSFAIWGIALYWWAAVLYGLQTRQLLRTIPPARTSAR